MMGTALFTWELGAGMGHVMRMAPLAKGLAARGHQVFAAMRQLPRAAAALAGSGVHLLQAPFAADGRSVFPTGVTYAHLLANCGFGDDAALLALAGAWRNLFRLTRPDLIVFDHSPAALVGARGTPARRVLIGTGYCCPPDSHPLPAARSMRNVDVNWNRFADDEHGLLMRVNRLLASWKVSPLKRLGQVFGEVEDRFLTTFKELDHFVVRGEAVYRGPVNATGGKAPCWPRDGARKRIFAYLKPYPGISHLLEVLRRRSQPTLIHLDGFDPKLRAQFESPTLRFETERLDPSAAARESDLAILHGTHGTTCDVLLAGKSILQIPLFGEQELIAEATLKLGAGRVVSPWQDDADAIEAALETLLTDKQYANASRDFASRHADFSPAVEQARMLDQLSRLLDK